MKDVVQTTLIVLTGAMLVFLTGYCFAHLVAGALQ